MKIVLVAMLLFSSMSCAMEYSRSANEKVDFTITGLLGGNSQCIPSSPSSTLVLCEEKSEKAYTYPSFPQAAEVVHNKVEDRVPVENQQFHDLMREQERMHKHFYVLKRKEAAADEKTIKRHHSAPELFYQPETPGRFLEESSPPSSQEKILNEMIAMREDNRKMDSSSSRDIALLRQEGESVLQYRRLHTKIKTHLYYLSEEYADSYKPRPELLERDLLRRSIMSILDNDASEEKSLQEELMLLYFTLKLQCRESHNNYVVKKLNFEETYKRAGQLERVENYSLAYKFLQKAFTCFEDALIALTRRNVNREIFLRIIDHTKIISIKADLDFITTLPGESYVHR